MLCGLFSNLHRQSGFRFAVIFERTHGCAECMHMRKHPGSASVCSLKFKKRLLDSLLSAEGKKI